MDGSGITRGLLKLGAVWLCLCGNLTAIGFATESATSSPQLVVRIGDLNLNDPKGVAAAYVRIRWAAERVCPYADSADYWVRVSAEPCITQAISRAVECIGSPRLKAYAQSQWPLRSQQMQDRARRSS